MAENQTQVKKENPYKVVTGKARLSYVQVFNVNDDGKYSLAVLIPKTDTATVAKINAAIEKLKQDPKAQQTWGGKFLANYKTPLRDGDTERDTDASPEYKGHWFLNASTKSKPQVVDQNVEPILSQDELYSGCYGRVSINFYAFNQDGGKGIAAGLNNVQKMADGDRLGGRSDAADDFGPVTEDEEEGFLS